MAAFNAISVVYVDGYVSFIKIFITTILFSYILWAAREYYPIIGEPRSLKPFLIWTPLIVCSLALTQFYNYSINDHFELNYLIINSILMISMVIVVTNFRYID